MPAEFTFHHIGLASVTWPRTGASRQLGFRAEGPVFEDPLQRIRGLFITLGAMRVELLQPLDDTSPLQGYLNRGIKIYHQGFLCHDIARSIQTLEAQQPASFRRQTGRGLRKPPHCVSDIAESIVDRTDRSSALGSLSQHTYVAPK